jgi:hypothetical protein
LIVDDDFGDDFDDNYEDDFDGSAGKDNNIFEDSRSGLKKQQQEELAPQDKSKDQQKSTVTKTEGKLEPTEEDEEDPES